MTAQGLCFDTGTAPAVGYTITLNTANVATPAAQSNWALLQSQAAAGNIDLIARGTVRGNLRGLLYRPSTTDYITNAGTVFAQGDLQGLIAGGDTLSFMGVYPGTGSASSQP